MTFQELFLKMGYKEDEFVSLGNKLQSYFSNKFLSIFPKETPPKIFDGTQFKTTPEDMRQANTVLDMYIKNHPPKSATAIDDRVYKMLKIFSSSNE